MKTKLIPRPKRVIVELCKIDVRITIVKKMDTIFQLFFNFFYRYFLPPNCPQFFLEKKIINFFLKSQFVNYEVSQIFFEKSFNKRTEFSARESSNIIPTL